MDRVIKCGCCTNDDYYCENCKSPDLDASACILPKAVAAIHIEIANRIPHMSNWEEGVLTGLRMALYRLGVDVEEVK